MKKYRLKKQHTFKPITIIILILLLLGCTSIGYSLWSQDLKISGTATAKNSSSGGGGETTDYPLGNSTYSYTIAWQSGLGTAENPLVYNIELKITNLDAEYTDGWTVSFDLPEGLNLSACTFWNISNYSISDDNRFTFSNADWDTWFLYEETKDLGFMFAFESTEPFTITNLTLQGLLATETETGTGTETETETEAGTGTEVD